MKTLVEQIEDRKAKLAAKPIATKTEQKEEPIEKKEERKDEPRKDSKKGSR